MADTDVQRICIIGGGAAGIGLAWSLARATELGLNKATYEVTLIHDQDQIGGHSWTQPNVKVGDQTVNIDCGVQAIAPKWYPMTMSMLDLDEFAGVGVKPLEMKISCVFPGDGPEEFVYWGNFGSYLQTELAQGGHDDCQAFQDLLAAKLSLGWELSLIETVDKLLQNNADQFTGGDPKHFITYFLDGYMSILNGYGNALLDELIVGDLAALWDLGYANFLAPIEDYGRFEQGAMEWVKRMWSLSVDKLGVGNVSLRRNTKVVELWPDTGSGPTIITEPAGGGPRTAPESFDVVVSTIDMRGNANILQNANNPLWDEVFEPAIGTPETDNYYATSVWKLNPGFCTLHQDASFVADTPREEVMQFNTLPGRIDDGPGFDLANSYTTYIVSNLNGIPDVHPDEDWYVTMFGFVPDEDKRPKNAVWSSPWTHGMFLPTFYIPEKIKFHRAQSVSPYHKAHSHQVDTGIYFAGNNLTMDAEEGALISGMAIAKYAFGIDPMPLVTPASGRNATVDKAEAMFDMFFDALMFPSEFEEALGEMGGLIAWFLKHWIPVITPPE
ncbi:MAG: NAD(P)-binding protein [Actinomycetota bacterium]